MARKKKKALPRSRVPHRPAPPAAASPSTAPPAPLIPEKASGNGDHGAPGPGISVADAGELAAIAAAVRDAEGAPPDREALGEAAVQAAEALAEGKVDAGALALLTEDELGDVFGLAFGIVADRRGAHWELSARSAKRLGKWIKRVLDKHGAAWLEKWLPELMAGLLIAYELGTRIREDRRLAASAAELAIVQ